MHVEMLTENEYDRLYLLSIRETEKLPENYFREHFPGRYERALQYRAAEDRLRCLTAGLLLYEVTGLKEDAIRTNRYGKPYAADEGIFFSLSHSGEYAALTVSRTAENGVDIERMSARVRRESLLRRACTDEERSWLAEGPDEEEAERFARIWTVKESVSKALGLGLGLPFESFSALPILTGQSLTCRGAVFAGSCMTVDHYVLSHVWVTERAGEGNKEI